MDASLASFQARLATFATTSKTRRTSTRSKKATAKSKIAWPHTSPAAQDLAYAGFVFRPTTASVDNVQCISCGCQLDGWEESDVPAHEHLTHSPNCGLAMFACIRLRNGDPGRVEEDPTSELMLRARLSTFGDWPLDTAAGFPSIDQMAAAGWFYDPTEEYPDSVTCPYCSLSLDSWDAGDSPMEEHHRREPNCLFFTLPELLRKEKSPSPPPKKAKRTSTAKATKVSKAPRASTRSSGASITAKKTTRGKKRASEAIDEPEISEPKRKASTRASRASTASTATKKITKGKKRASDAVEESTFSEIAPRQSSKRIRTSSMSSLPDDLLAGTPKKPSTQVDEAEASDIEMPGQEISLSEAAPKKNVNGVSSVGMSSLSFIPPPMPYIPAQNKAPENKENAPAPEPEVSDSYSGSYPTETSGFPTGMAHGTPKWTPSFKYLTESDTGDREMSSFPSDLPCGTPKKTPSHLKESNAGTPKKTPSHFTMSSLPPDLLQGTPRRTPSMYKDEDSWKAIDIDAFFANHTSVDGFMNDILIDAGLDDIACLGSNPQDLYTAVMAGLTDTEKKMTIQEWVLYNAKRGEEKLRQECEKQIAAFEALGRQAVARIERMPTRDSIPAN